MSKGYTPQRPTGQRPEQPQREPTPKGKALYEARLVTARNPEQEQPDVYVRLQKAIGCLDEDEGRKLIFNLVGETLQEHERLPGLFAASRLVKTTGEDGRVRSMESLAHATAAVVKAMRAGLTPSNLQELGLVEVKPGVRKDGSNFTYVVPHVGRRNIEGAVQRLKERRDPALAPALRELSAYLTRGEWGALRAQAVKAKASEATPATPGTDEEKGDTA